MGAFQRSLAIPGSEDVHALVVTRAGAVLARAHGEADEDSWRAMAPAIGDP